MEGPRHPEGWRSAAPPPSRPIPCGSGEALGDPDAASPFVRTLSDVHEELRAYLFLFVEVGCVGATAAGNKRLHGCVWDDSVFWRCYGGPCIASEPSTCTASALRDGFRKWLFHLDGEWTQDFRNFVEQAKKSEFGADYTQLLADARYTASGLQPEDNREQVEEFVEIIRELLSEYDAAQMDERCAAEALVAQVERRNDVFEEAQTREVASTYDQSVERAILDRDIEDGGSEPDPFLDPLDPEGTEDEPSGALADWDRWDPPELAPPGSDDDVGLGDREADGLGLGLGAPYDREDLGWPLGGALGGDGLDDLDGLFGNADGTGGGRITGEQESFWVEPPR